jgi:molybdate transport system substrate-binding protein
MKIRSISTFIVIGALALSATLVSLFAQQATNPNAIQVMASNGIHAVLDDVRAKSETAVGKPLVMEFNSSNAQVDRIEKGAQFDVAILTSDTIDDLINKGKIVPGTRTDLARAGIGVGVRKGAAKPDISSGQAIKKALLAAKTVTYAQDGASRVHVEMMFGRLGISQEMAPKIRLEQGSPRSAALVAQGKADMILTLMSEILPIEGISLVGPLPSEYQYYVGFAAGIGVKAKHADAGKALIQFLSSPAMHDALAAKGMETAQSHR